MLYYIACIWVTRTTRRGPLQTSNLVLILNSYPYLPLPHLNPHPRSCTVNLFNPLLMSTAPPQPSFDVRRPPTATYEHATGEGV